MVFLFLHVLLQYLEFICSPVFFIIYIETPYHFFDHEQVSFDSWILDSWILGCSGLAVVLVILPTLGLHDYSLP